MTRWKLTLEYDGSHFCGWQKQQHDLSVQQVLEDAIRKFSGVEVTLHVAGRTDAGVHAEAQVAHFDIDKETTAEIIRDAVNFYVRPHKVSVVNVVQVAEDFHARFTAKERSYRYQIINRRAPSALWGGYTWQVAKPLDEKLMQDAATMLIGKHDFSTFRAQNCQATSPVKTLDKFTIRREGEWIYCEPAARSFLYHQVRNMVGTLVMVGTGQWSLDQFHTAFQACDRTQGGPKAPAQGLFFVNVTYPQN